MPDEQRQPKQDLHERTKPEEARAEDRAPTRPRYVTEDCENPLICRGID